MKPFLHRIFLFISFSLFLITVSHAQSATKQQLKQQLQTLSSQKNHLKDTAYLHTVNRLATFYADGYPDSALLILKNVAEQCKDIGYYHGQTDAYTTIGSAFQTKGNFDSALQYYNQAYKVAIESHYKTNIPVILGNIALVYQGQGNYTLALKKFYAALSAAEAEGNQLLIGNNLNNIGNIYFYQGKMKEAEQAFTKTLKISQQLKDTANIIFSYNNIGEVNIEEHELEKALMNLSIAYNLVQHKNMPDALVAVSNTLGDCYFQMDSAQIALALFEKSLNISKKTDNARGTCKALIGLAKVNNRLGLHKDALQYGLAAVQKSKEMGQIQLQRDAVEILSQIYEQSGDGMDALKYYKEYKTYSDSLVNLGNVRMAADLKASYNLSQKEQEFQRKTVQQRWMIFTAFAAFLTTLIIILVVYRNKKRLSQTYKVLQQKNLVIQGQKLIAEETLVELKATQSQLIQSEKMASLGELTAGIAHEIQNPLNFVNNFSEVSSELLDEMNAELDKGDFIEVKALAGDIKQNLEKINHHGKRADSIVKGMLQHSRKSTGVKEPTDLNALCDEYLHLSYHGLRAKDKSFNATIKTDFDDGIGKVNIIPQDFGRVILNLLNNGFYAVNKRLRQAQSDKLNDTQILSKGNENYEPTVSISTKKVNDKIIITVSDNGSGMSQEIKNKIFQPFFTTKPTGEGTGLGLSLSYDIITKGHNSELKVDSKENEGTTFSIILANK